MGGGGAFIMLRGIQLKKGVGWSIYYAVGYKKLITIGRSNLCSSIEYMNKMGGGNLLCKEAYKPINIGRSNLSSSIEYMNKLGEGAFIMLRGIINSFPLPMR